MVLLKTACIAILLRFQASGFWSSGNTLKMHQKGSWVLGMQMTFSSSSILGGVHKPGGPIQYGPQYTVLLIY